MVEVSGFDPIFYEFPIHHLPTIVKVRKCVKCKVLKVPNVLYRKCKKR